MTKTTRQKFCDVCGIETADDAPPVQVEVTAANGELITVDVCVMGPSPLVFTLDGFDVCATCRDDLIQTAATLRGNA